MSISDRLHHAFVWFTVSAFCVLFALIYYIFSHGVHSPYMTFLFAIPLVLGVGANLAAAGISFICGRYHSDTRKTKPASAKMTNIAVNLYYSGIAAITASSMLRGIFDIAGTSSVYQTFLMYAGLAMTACGAAVLLIRLTCGLCTKSNL